MSRLPALLLLLAACVRAPAPSPAPVESTAAPPPASQNPSPMVEHTRAHERLPTDTPPGLRFEVDAGLGKPVPVFVPQKVQALSSARLLVHFHGGSLVPAIAAARARAPYVVAAVQLGSGSSVYARPFADSTALPRLRAAIADSLAARLPRAPSLDTLVLSAWSAGYGAVRSIIARDAGAREVAAVLLIDGLHTGYIPDRTPLASGRALDTVPLAPFARYARRAIAGEARMLVTHSEIFPGTFASTTETTDWLLDASGVERRAVLRWGPRGLQQLSEAAAGGFALRGYAGNSAPDHVDQLHALPELLDALLP